MFGNFWKFLEIFGNFWFFALYWQKSGENLTFFCVFKLGWSQFLENRKKSFENLEEFQKIGTTLAGKKNPCFAMNFET